MLFNIVYIVWNPENNQLLTTYEHDGETFASWQPDTFKAEHYTDFETASKAAKQWKADVLEIKVAYEVRQVVNNEHLAHYRPKHQVIS